MADPTADIRAAALEHFQKKRGELRFVEVPEWPVQGQPGRIYYYPVPNGAEWIEILNCVDQESGHLDLRAYLIAFRLFARDASGTLLFNRITGLDELERNYDFDVIRSVVERMGVMKKVGDEEEGSAAAGKPSPETIDSD